MTVQPGSLQQPLGQATVGAKPDHLDPVAVADRVPRWSAGQHVDVFEDRLLAEQLEPVIEIRSPWRLALRRDQSAPVLLVEQPRCGGADG